MKTQLVKLFTAFAILASSQLLTSCVLCEHGVEGYEISATGEVVEEKPTGFGLGFKVICRDAPIGDK